MKTLPKTWSERDVIYLEILHYGLLRIRDLSALGHIEYCAVESEHLHNIPSLIGETNQYRHNYYFQQERSYYLERVSQSLLGLEFSMQRYEELWASLSKLNEIA